ncbi:MAG: hypothetical protein WB756_17895 [Xanthobacteraceae bacterium]
MAQTVVELADCSHGGHSGGRLLGERTPPVRQIIEGCRTARLARKFVLRS